MIDVRELRIGNWVKFPKQSDEQPVYLCVEIVSEKHLNQHESGKWAAFLKDCDPIPLTPEILEKSGMQYTDMDKSWEFPGLGDYFNFTLLDNKLTLFVGNVCEYETNTDMLYYHQLQNLFHALTCKELTIFLP